MYNRKLCNYRDTCIYTCKLYKCFDLFLLNHHKTIVNGVFIRDLCLLRENNIVDDDQDLTSTELTYMIDCLCTS